MKKFDVYLHPVKGYKVVKEGFSWPGFLFSVFWFMIKGLWGSFIFLFVAFFITYMLFEAALISGDRAMIMFLLLLELAIFIFIGYRGNKWVCNSLSKRGYRWIKKFSASTPDAAMAMASTVLKKSEESLKVVEDG